MRPHQHSLAFGKLAVIVLTNVDPSSAPSASSSTSTPAPAASSPLVDSSCSPLSFYRIVLKPEVVSNNYIPPGRRSKSHVDTDTPGSNVAHDKRPETKKNPAHEVVRAPLQPPSSACTTCLVNVTEINLIWRSFFAAGNRFASSALDIHSSREAETDDWDNEEED